MAKPAAALLAALVAAPLWPQSVDIYSEFHRVDPFGAVVLADRGVSHREILSPGVARNGHASFHVAVSVPPKESYLLYVVTNPVNACRVSLYREHFVNTRDGWIPDSLVELERLPDFGTLPDPSQKIEGQTTRLYLLDIWIPPDAGIGRFRLEVQLKVAGWIIRPMEVRVLSPRIPGMPGANARPVALPPIEAGTDRSAMQAMADYLAGAPPRSFPNPTTLREIIRRNADQDFRLARTVSGPATIAGRFLELLRLRSILGSEHYLRIRDFLYAH
jgi:hypothetical protein